MAYKTEKLNPSTSSFIFRMDEYDCLALRTGLCSLHLSDDEAAAIDRAENVTGKSNVMHCRVLKKALLNVNYYENAKYQSDSFSNRIHQRDCDHYVFTDGQHRSCIAKQLNLQTMYVSKEIKQSDSFIVCNACHEKSSKEKEKKTLSTSAELGFSVTNTYGVSDSQDVNVAKGKSKTVKAFPTVDIYNFNVYNGSTKKGSGNAQIPMGVCFVQYSN